MKLVISATSILAESAQLQLVNSAVSSASTCQLSCQLRCNLSTQLAAQVQLVNSAGSSAATCQLSCILSAQVNDLKNDFKTCRYMQIHKTSLLAKRLRLCSNNLVMLHPMFDRPDSKMPRDCLESQTDETRLACRATQAVVVPFSSYSLHMSKSSFVKYKEERNLCRCTATEYAA